MKVNKVWLSFCFILFYYLKLLCLKWIIVITNKLVFFLTYLTPLRINQRLFYFVYLYVIDLQTTDREHLMIIEYHIDNNNFSHYAVESKILHCNNVLPPRAAYPNLKSKHWDNFHYIELSHRSFFLRIEARFIDRKHNFAQTLISNYRGRFKLLL